MWEVDLGLALLLGFWHLVVLVGERWESGNGWASRKKLMELFSVSLLSELYYREFGSPFASQDVAEEGCRVGLHRAAQHHSALSLPPRSPGGLLGPPSVRAAKSTSLGVFKYC